MTYVEIEALSYSNSTLWVEQKYMVICREIQ